MPTRYECTPGGSALTKLTGDLPPRRVSDAKRDIRRALVNGGDADAAFPLCSRRDVRKELRETWLSATRRINPGIVTLFFFFFLRKQSLG